MSISIHTKNKLAALAVTMILAGCGSNASISKRTAAPALAKQEPAPQAEPAPGSAPLKPADEKISAGKPATVPVAEQNRLTQEKPATPPVVVASAPGAKDGIDGKAGPAGKDGAAGRDAPRECRTSDQPPATFNAIRMEESDYKVEELPYVSTKDVKKGRKVTKGKKIGILQIGEGSEGKLAYGTNYVVNSQVLFKFPVSLPPKDSITHFNHAYIQLSLVKVSEDSYPDTEWICFLDQKICSGKYFENFYKKGGDAWSRTINREFWGTPGTSDSKLKGEVTDYFTTEFKGSRVGKRGRSTIWKQEALQLRLEDLIRGSTYESVKDFLFDGSPSDGYVKKDIRLAVADDTKVISAQLVLDYEADTCKFGEVAASEAPGTAPAVPAEPSAPAAPAAPAALDTPAALPNSPPTSSTPPGAPATEPAAPTDPLGPVEPAAPVDPLAPDLAGPGAPVPSISEGALPDKPAYKKPKSGAKGSRRPSKR